MVEQDRCHDINAWEPRKLKSLLQESTQTSTDKEVLSVTVANGIYPAREGARESNPGESLEKYKVVHENDIVYNSMRLWQGAIAISHYEGIVSPAYTVCIPSVHINPDFISYLLKRPAALRMFYSLSQGNSKDTLILKYPLFSTIKFSLPTGREQYHIARLLRCVDQLIDAEKRKLDLLQKKKRALLRQIFEQKLRFAGYNNPWERCRLGDITEFADYGIAASAIPYDGTVRYLRITDIDDETRQVNIYELPSPDMKHRSRKEDYLRQGDLVFARTGASVGKTYLNRSDRDDIVHAGFLIRFRLKDNICPEFIYQQTLGENYRKFIAITSQRSGQPGINSSEYADWTLYLTSIEEQNQIGGLFGQLDELIAALTQKIDLLMIKKKALLQQMFV